MAAKTGGSSFVLHPPCPKSPPKYPDLYGKRREKAKVQMLEREISFLEDDLKSVEGFQPASRYCKEVTDFVMANSDPFIPPGLPCCNLACFCCCCNSGCSCYLKCPECCDGDLCDHGLCNNRRSSAAELRNGGVALVLNLDVAMERSRAAEIVAVSGFLHAQTAVLADGDALVLNVRRYAIAAVVQKPVVTHAVKML
ncbi:hypothetical protein V6N13_095058 [Hibiscus sabdariffa]